MREIILVVFMFLFILNIVGIVSAFDTQIKIKTIPKQEVQLTLFNPSDSSFSVIERFKGISDEYGDISFNHSSSYSQFGILIYIKQDGVTLISKKYPDAYTAGGVIDLRIAPDWFEFVETPSENISSNMTNVTERNVSVSNQTINQSNGFISSKTITKLKNNDESLLDSILSGDLEIFSYRVFYIIIGILVWIDILIIGLKIKRRYSKKRDSSEKEENIKVKKLSDIQTEKSKEKKEKDDDIPIKETEELKEAEKKLKEAQKQVEKLKTEEKIKEIKSKMMDYEKDLIRLRKKEKRNSE